MAAVQSLPALQGDDGFALTPHDTQTVDQHTGNTVGYKFCFVHNPSAGGAVKVTTVRGKDLTVYINQGDVFPLAVIRVWATPAPPANLIGIVGR